MTLFFFLLSLFHTTTHTLYTSIICSKKAYGVAAAVTVTVYTHTLSTYSAHNTFLTEGVVCFDIFISFLSIVYISVRNGSSRRSFFTEITKYFCGKILSEHWKFNCEKKREIFLCNIKKINVNQIKCVWLNNVFKKKILLIN